MVVVMAEIAEERRKIEKGDKGWGVVVVKWRSAVELFEHFHNDFEKIQNEVKDRKLVVTGIALGGYIAILYTLWLHHTIDEKRKPDSKITTRPICITFGSPLLGDKALESAISERPEWKSSFLNVVSTSDPFACFFSSNTRYKPIGTFVFCTQSSGHTTFEDNDAILAILDKMASSRSGSNPGISRQMHDYENDLRSIRSNVLYRGACEVAGELDSNALREGITLQFREIGALDISNDLIEKLMEGEHEKMRKRMNTKRLEGNLNKRKIKMAKMELFISSRRSRRGYYDRFKSGPMTIDELSGHNEIINSHESLNQYWDEFVKEKQLMPQKEGVSLRKRWLYSGNNYRRMFEPLYIAEYYKKGNISYIENRPNRYRLLEKWWNEDKKNLNPNERKEKGPNVNDDSCFWARVEEALISLRILTNGSSSSNGVCEKEQKLDNFMTYMMHSVNDYSLSSDTFLEGSSLMQWWREYNAYKKGLCTSKFAEYMKSGRYKSYQ
ncbi:senescence-associated carboxylesterase 101 [Helianthus annuus]|uniref:senescence-associated carboxylesterase 101 n=1 Tax=Helianthus annuus TaxID=4232 RepID=UPI001652D49D|nr:senescence-associated carboxylesterase 101 [Helianthus annuus]